MSLPLLWATQGDVRITVSPHALARLHALPEETKLRLQETLNEIGITTPSFWRSSGALLRLHVDSFVILYTFSGEEDLVVQHILAPDARAVSERG